jgi:hypothetical protein
MKRGIQKSHFFFFICVVGKMQVVKFWAILPFVSLHIFFCDELITYSLHHMHHMNMQKVLGMTMKIIWNHE